MDPQVFEFTLEQQFQLKLVESSVLQMSPEQSADTIVKLTRLIMVKDNIIRDLVKKV